VVKSKLFKNCIALFLITLVAGLLLALVNEVTKEPIANAELQAKFDAYDVVFEGAEFVDENALAFSSYIPESNCSVDDVLSAVDKDGNKIGYVMSVTSPSGYGGDVTIAIGISCETDTITGFTVLSHSETAGLGARCTEEEFQSQFKGKSANGISYVKGGGATTDTEIDAISGATITTSAVTDAVNTALDFYNNALKEG
jgi:electron transport complex protein RnfG